MPDDEQDPTTPEEESFEIDEEAVDEEAEAAKQVSDALDQVEVADLDLDDGAREPEIGVDSTGFDAIESGPTEFVNFTDADDDEDDEAAEDLPIPRTRSALIPIIVLANVIILSGAGYLFWQKYEAHQKDVLTHGAGPGGNGEPRQAAITQRITRTDTPEREVEDSIRTRKMECQLDGIIRDRVDPSRVTVRLSREFAFDVKELKQQIDSDAGYVLTRVFAAVPAVRKVTVTVRSRIETDKRGLNPKMADAFRITLTRDQQAKAEYGKFDSLKKLSAYYHPKLAKLKPPKKSGAETGDWE